MSWLNYHHLLYFWKTARMGGVASAARELRLSQPTLSKQIHVLEKALGAPLFEKRGRGLVLTDAGRRALGYAEEIFRLGGELSTVFAGGLPDLHPPLRLGITDAVPKLVARGLVHRVVGGLQPYPVSCVEGNFAELLEELAALRLDAVIGDHSPGPAPQVRFYTRRIAASPVGLFAAPMLYRKLRRSFPRSLDGAPALLPTLGSALRLSLDRWFAEQGVRPRVVAECEDSALLKMLGHDGLGFFPAPTLVARELASLYGCREVGRAGGLAEDVLLITVERRTPHPALGRLTLPEGLNPDESPPQKNLPKRSRRASVRP